MALPNRKVNNSTESKSVENNTNVENNNAEIERIKELRNSEKWKAMYIKLNSDYGKNGQRTKEQEATFLKMIDRLCTLPSVDTRSSKSLVNSFDSFSKNFNS